MSAMEKNNYNAIFKGVHMNKRYLASVFCITILALAPACAKKASKNTSEDVKDVNTMIEIDNAVVEVDNPEEIVIKKKSLAKF
jgi:hypothetical protein